MKRIAVLALVALLAGCAAPVPPPRPRPSPVSADTAQVAPTPPLGPLDAFLGHLRAALTETAKARAQVDAALLPGATVRVSGADPASVQTWLRRQRDQLDAIAAALLETVKRVEQAKADGVLIEAPGGMIQGGVGQ